MAELRDQAASKAKNAALVETFAANAAAKAAAARAEEAAAAQRRENAAFVTAPGGGAARKLPPPPPSSGGEGGEGGVLGMDEDYTPGPDQVTTRMKWDMVTAISLCSCDAIFLFLVSLYGFFFTLNHSIFCCWCFQASVLARDDNKLVFTSTHEFSSRLESSMQERARARDSAAAAAAAAAAGAKVPPPPPPRPSSGPGASGGVGSSEDVEMATDSAPSSGGDVGSMAEASAPPGTSSGDGGDEGEEEDEGEGGGVHGDSQMGFMHRQPLARGGMAATLGLLAQSGDLGSKRGYNVEQQVKRATKSRGG